MQESVSLSNLVTLVVPSPIADSWKGKTVGLEKLGTAMKRCF